MVKFVVYLIIFISLIVIYARYIEGRSIFFPMKEPEFMPDAESLGLEDVYLTTPDNIKINGWFFLKAGAKYTLLFCHGNAGNMGHRLDKIAMLQDIDLNIFIIDYRGYGKSEGRPSEPGIYKDAKTAYDYLINEKNIRPEAIILYGESIGGAVVIDLASKVKVGAVITEDTFSSVIDMAKRVYPFLPSFLFSIRLDSVSKIKNINAPILIIHSKNDEIVPFDMGKKLFDAAKEPKEFAEIAGAHNTAYIDSKEKYIASIRSFINGL